AGCSPLTGIGGEACEDAAHTIGAELGLHAAVKEVDPTQEEWLQAIMFLTDTGHKCDDWRQEFILLSDVLGVSMLVDAPERPMGLDICLDGKGARMLVKGRILDTEGNPVAGAKIDVWQTNDDGFDDVQQKGIRPDFNFRGVFRTGDDGSYWFWGAKPRSYPIPDDGPVGKLLGALGRHPYRPAHLPTSSRRQGFKPLSPISLTPTMNISIPMRCLGSRNR
ncbi:dioxygenase, partial [Yoonia sp.]|uniref:dioxygenase family protein n=1 Tax=Yoonia sp. TaxID=2212373 RepID=UPI0025D677CB